MQAAKQQLGVPDFAIKYIEGTPHHQQYLQSNNQEKCYLEAMWLSSQLNYYFEEKQKGNWYPALGPQEEWLQKQQGGAGDADTKNSHQNNKIESGNHSGKPRS
jgi:hypothetical protein